MGRKIQEIYDEMATEKSNLSSLNGLLPNTTTGAYAQLLTQMSSNSKVAIWRLIMYVVAVAQYKLEMLWDYAKQEMEIIAQKSIAGNLQWYRNEVMKWQFNFLLLWNGTTFRYYYSDTNSTAAIDSRLAKKVACVEVFNTDFRGVKIKVAKEVSGALVPLAQNEVDSLQAYVDRIKFAGVETDIISQAADKLLLSVKLYYQGTLDDTTILTTAKDSIKNYLKNLDFDGVFYLSKMVDELQKISGMVDVVLVSSQAKTYLGSYQAFLKDYNPESGWIEYDNTSTLQLIKV
jgi:hypothetical protein